MKILVDADACPYAVKEVLFRVAQRRQVMTTLVANQSMRVPQSKWIGSEVVGRDPDAADDRIVELVRAGDLVVTADIPLASRVIDAGGGVITPVGDLLSDRNVKQRLATRDLMDELRNDGIVTGGPAPFSEKDRETFTNQLDRFLTRHFRRST